MAELVAQGSAGSLLSLAAYDTGFDEGDRGRLEIDMVFIPFGVLSALQAAMDIAGVDATVSSAPGSVIVVDFTKRLGLLAVAIALAVVFVAATLLLVTAWALFRSVITETTVTLGLLLGLGVVALVLLGGPRGRTQRAKQRQLVSR